MPLTVMPVLNGIVLVYCSPRKYSKLYMYSLVLTNTIIRFGVGELSAINGLAGGKS